MSSLKVKYASQNDLNPSSQSQQPQQQQQQQNGFLTTNSNSCCDATTTTTTVAGADATTTNPTNPTTTTLTTTITNLIEWSGSLVTTIATAATNGAAAAASLSSPSVTAAVVVVGVLAIVLAVAIVAISTISSVSTLFTLVANLATLCQAGFFLFSLFAWLYLIASHLHVVKCLLVIDDHLIYSAFVLAFTSEFLVQFIVFNCMSSAAPMSSSSSSSSSSSLQSTSSSSSSSTTSTTSATVDSQVFLESFLFVIVFVCLATLLILVFFSDQIKNNQQQQRARIYLRFLFLATLTRLYGSISFGSVLPQSTCSYCAYVSAFAGLMFAHYINYILERISSEYSRLPATPTTLTKTATENRNTIETSNLAGNAINRGQSSASLSRNNRLSEKSHHHHHQQQQQQQQLLTPQLSSLRVSSQHVRTAASNATAVVPSSPPPPSSSSSSSSSSFRRRTSLPTIPFKIDKSSNLDHSAIVREIKLRIDDLMSDASSSATTGAESIAPILLLLGNNNNDNSNGISTSSSAPGTSGSGQQQHHHNNQNNHHHQTVNRLLKGLRAIRNLINRSSLNQMVLDRQLRQHHQHLQQQSPQSSPIVQSSKTRKTIDIRQKDGESDEEKLGQERHRFRHRRSAGGNDTISSLKDTNNDDDDGDNDDDADDDDDNEENDEEEDEQVREDNEDKHHHHQSANQKKKKKRRNSLSADDLSHDDYCSNNQDVPTSASSSSTTTTSANAITQQVTTTATVGDTFGSSSSSGRKLLSQQQQQSQQSQTHRNRKSLPTHLYRKIFNADTTKRPHQNGAINNNNNNNNGNNNNGHGSSSESSSSTGQIFLKRQSSSECLITQQQQQQQQQLNSTITSNPISSSAVHHPTSSQQLDSYSPSSNSSGIGLSSSLSSASGSSSKDIPSTSSCSSSSNSSQETPSSVLSSRLDESKEENRSSGTSQIQQLPNNNNNNNNNNSKTSDYESGESPTNSDCNSDTDKLQLRPQIYHESSIPTTTTPATATTSMQYHERLSQKRLEQIREEINHKFKMTSPTSTATATMTSELCATLVAATSSSSSPPSLNLTFHESSGGSSDHQQQITRENSSLSPLPSPSPMSPTSLTWSHPDDLERNADLLNCLHDWNFPIFRFAQRAQKFILSQMACKIFEEVGLFKSFDIQIDKFINYFTALESGYIDLPYHNRIHAADVLHACYYLTTQAVPNCSSTNKYISELHMESAQNRKRARLDSHQYSLKYCQQDSNDDGSGGGGYGCLGDNFTQLEILALYCSAAMHDYEHPGRNNAFLITINSPLALLYNDKSVLENHHASASWLLLKPNENFNFLSNLDTNEWKKLRMLIIENILATDLGRHFTILKEFNSKFNKSRTLGSCKETGILSTKWDEHLVHDFPDKSTPVDWTNEQDRLIASQMILKLADINAPLKRKELHVQWTNRIVEEFYQQGDEEASLGLPMSPFMDRSKPQVAKLQESFINGLVGSLCDSYTYAGLLPGAVIDDEIKINETDSSNEKKVIGEKRFQCEMITNLKSNYRMWCAKVKQEEEDAAAAAALAAASTTT